MLRVVEFVLRSKLSVDAGDDVNLIISSFLIEDMTLEQAYKWSPATWFGLVDFVWTRGLREVKSSRWTLAKLVHTEPHYYRWEFSVLLVAAVKRSDLGMVQWALTHFSGCPVNSNVVYQAAERGHLWLLELLEKDTRHCGIEWRVSALKRAARFRHWRIVRWLDERVNTPASRQTDYKVLAAAIQQSDFDQVKWAASRGFGFRYPFNHSFCKIDVSVWQEHVRIVRYLLKLGLRECAGHVLLDAAMVGDLDFMQWLSSRYTFDNATWTRVLGRASEYGRLPVLHWALLCMDQLHFYYDLSDVMFRAAKGGSLGVIQWLWQVCGHNLQSNLFRPKEKENIEKIQVCTAMDAAACNGHLDVLQFLHGIDLALRDRWKRSGEDNLENYVGPTCTSAAMDGAAASGFISTVKWLHSNRSEGCTTYAMDYAAGGDTEYDLIGSNLSTADRLAVLRWLHANRSEGCTTKAMHFAAANGDLRILQWQHANTTAGCTTKAMDNAARCGHLGILEWLHENRSEGCTSETMEVAVSHGHLDMMKWLHIHRPEIHGARDLKTLTARWTGLLDDNYLRFRVTKWLTTNRPGYQVFDLMGWALRTKSFEAALFLYNQHPDYKVYYDLPPKKIVIYLHDLTRGMGFRVWVEETFLFDDEDY